MWLLLRVLVLLAYLRLYSAIVAQTGFLTSSIINDYLNSQWQITLLLVSVCHMFSWTLVFYSQIGGLSQQETHCCSDFFLQGIHFCTSSNPGTWIQSCIRLLADEKQIDHQCHWHSNGSWVWIRPGAGVEPKCFQIQDKKPALSLQIDSPSSLVGLDSKNI